MQSQIHRTLTFGLNEELVDGIMKEIHDYGKLFPIDPEEHFGRFRLMVEPSDQGDAKEEGFREVLRRAFLIGPCTRPFLFVVYDMRRGGEKIMDFKNILGGWGLRLYY